MNWAPKETIVVPVDFSDESFAAIDVALQIVSAPAGVHVVNVLSDLSATDVSGVMAALDVAGRRRHVEQDLSARLADAKYRDLQINIFIGDPGHEIAAFAERVGADLIVIPSHGRTGIKHFLIGSVAERVVRLAHCPVLVLRK
jgi:nucleotide-binding universal stress UspA family protein